MVLVPFECTSTLAGVIIIIQRNTILTIASEADHTHDVAFCDTFQERLAAVKTSFLV